MTMRSVVSTDASNDSPISAVHRSEPTAADELRAALGDAHVQGDAAALDRAARATIPGPQRPGLVATPGDAAEVACVLRIAARHGLHVWPVSTGKNWGYGSATAVRSGAVQLRLERMNRILEVNDTLGYAVVEPGVTYRQLRRHLDEHHPHLWSDCTDGPPDGSVLGNALDRGLGVTHYSDHFGTLCGLEVVLPDGSVMRTGGGPPDCKTWHTHKWGVGPYVEGLFAQGNFGVVTKAGVWLMPRPEAFASFVCDVHDAAKLPRLVDAMRSLAMDGVLQSASHIVNDVVALAVLDRYPAEAARESRLPDALRAAMRERLAVPAWSFGGGIQGTHAMVRAMKKEVARRLEPVGRVLFMNDRLAQLAGRIGALARHPKWGRGIDRITRALTGRSGRMLEAAPHGHELLKGVPSDFFVQHAYFKSAAPKPDVADPDRDGCGLIWFAPIVPMTGEHVDDMLSLMQPLFLRHRFDFYAALLVQNARSMIVLTSIFFRKSDPDESGRAKALYDDLAAATARAGYQEYRVGVSGMHHVAETSPELMRFVRSLKASVDPGGVLAPGKYGI